MTLTNNKRNHNHNDLISEIKRQSRFEYRNIDLTTIAGINQADKMIEDGWKVIRSGFFSVQLEREREREREVSQ